MDLVAYGSRLGNGDIVVHAPTTTRTFTGGIEESLTAAAAWCEKNGWKFDFRLARQRGEAS